MTGLLRYAVLKNSRNGSLLTLLLAPTAMIAAPMLAIWLFDRSGRLRMPAEVASDVSIMSGALMAALAAFMTFRTEIANHTIGTFVLATRSWSIPVASAVYGCLIGIGSALLANATLFISMGIVHTGWIEFLTRVTIFSLAAASGGALAILLSQSMAAGVWVYMLTCVLVAPPWKDDPANDALRMGIAVTIALVCVPIAALLVERRCAA